MKALKRPTFRSAASKQIYQYVERHGTAARHRARSVLDMSPEQYRNELEWLIKKNYVEDDEGTLRIKLDAGTVEEHVGEEFRYTIRPARQDDFEGLVEMIRDVTDEGTYMVAESIAERLLYEDTVTRHNTVESRVFFVATHDGDVIGWVHLILPQLERVRGAAKLTVGVREEYRRNGVGSQLLDRGLDWAEANGYTKVYNSVPATNDEALAFLEAHDWHTEGVRRDHYTVDGRPVDEVMMAYTF